MLDDVKKTFVEIPRNIDTLTLSNDNMNYLCLFKDEIPLHINEIVLPEINDMKTLASIADNMPVIRNIGLTNVPESEDYQQFFAIISRFSGLSLLRLPQNSSQFYKNLPSSIARFGLGSLPATDSHTADFKTLPDSVQVLIIKEGMFEHDILALMQRMPESIKLVRFDGQVYESSLKSLPPFIRGIRFPIPELDDINLIFSNIPCQVHTIYLNFLDIRDHNHARAIFSSIPKHIQYIAEFSEQELPDKSILGCIPKNAFFTIHFLGLSESTRIEYGKITPKYVFIGTGEEVSIYPEWLWKLMRVKVDFETSS